jgi:hypothetical protein
MNFNINPSKRPSPGIDPNSTSQPLIYKEDLPEDRIPVPDSWLLRQFASIGCSPRDASTLVEWCRISKDRKPVVLVGAGFSRNAVLKPQSISMHEAEPPKIGLWRDLAIRFQKKLEQDGEKNEQDPLWLAELLEQKFKSREPLMALLRDAMPVEKFDCGPVHRQLARIPWEVVLTTNYDFFIEQGFRDVGRDYHMVVSESDLSCREPGTPIIHVHGTFDRPESIIITLDDYRTYADNHPGILVKVRQLFLEHPLMLIGFGATDPNFIEWSGWVRDLVGRFHLPAINIVVSDSGPGEPRRRYWQEAFSYIHISKDKIESLLALLGKAVSGVHPREIMTIIREDLKSAKSVEDAIAMMIGLGRRQLSTDPPEQSWRRQKTAAETAHRIIEIQYTDPSAAAQIWSKLAGYSKEIATAIRESSRWSMELTTGYSKETATAIGTDTVDSYPSINEQLQILRDAIGEYWVDFLHALQSLGLDSFSIEHLRVDIPEECEMLPIGEAGETVAKLRFRQAMDEIHRDLEQDVDRVLEKWVKDRTLTEDEKAEIDDVKCRQALRGNTELPSPDTQCNSPAALRRAACISALNGSLKLSAELYRQAAKESFGVEDPIVELLTVEAAWQTQKASKWESQGPLSIATDDFESTLDLESRRKALRIKCENWVEWIERKKRNLRDNIIERLQKELSAYPNMTDEAFPPTQGELLEFFESHWAEPFEIGSIAELTAYSAWLDGQRPKALRIFSRYGIELLEVLIKDYSRSIHRKDLNDIIDSLLLKGRWPSEWNARLKAMPHVVAEMNQEQLATLDSWVVQCQKSLVEINSKLSVLNGSSVSFLTGADKHIADRLAETILSRWRYLSFDEFEKEWYRITAGADAKHCTKNMLVASLSAGVGDLPLKLWIYDGADRTKLLNVIRNAVDKLDEYNWPHGNGIFSLLNGFWQYNPSSPCMDNVPDDLLRRFMEAIVNANEQHKNIYCEEELYWTLVFASEDALKIEVLNSMISEIESRYDERVYPGKRNWFVNILAYAGLQHIRKDTQILNRTVELVENLKSRMEGVTITKGDDIALAHHKNSIESLAILCSQMILLNFGEDIEAQCINILDACLSRSLSAAASAASVPTSKLPKNSRERLEAIMSGENWKGDSDIEVDVTELGHLKIDVCWQRIASNPDEGIGYVWAHELGSLTKSNDQSVARNACDVLGEAIFRDKLRTDKREPLDLSFTFETLISASQDPRAEVTGAAASAIVKAVSAYPNDTQKLLPVLAKLKADPRAEVRFRIRESEVFSPVRNDEKKGPSPDAAKNNED